MDKFCKDTWENLIPVDMETQKLIRSKGILSGSTLFGGGGDDSDIDYIVRYTPDIMNRLTNQNSFSYYKSRLYKEPDTLSVYVKFDKIKRPINLIVCNSDESFKAWTTATKLFAFFIQSDLKIEYKVIKDKNYRVSLFKSFREMLKNVFTNFEEYSQDSTVNDDYPDDDIPF